jgi:hypothetical protein
MARYDEERDPAPLIEDDSDLIAVMLQDIAPEPDI